MATDGSLGVTYNEVTSTHVETIIGPAIFAKNVLSLYVDHTKADKYYEEFMRFSTSLS